MAASTEQDQENQQLENTEIEREEESADSVITSGADEAEKKRAQPPSQGIPSMTFTIWPPSQRTRDSVTNRLIDTLSMESLLSKRYGIITHGEAVALARQIEEEAFSIASSSDPAPADAPGAEELEIETLQMYSKEISKRMLSSVKARAPPAPASPTSAYTAETSPPSSAAAPDAGDDAPSMESETSLA